MPDFCRILQIFCAVSGKGLASAPDRATVSEMTASPADSPQTLNSVRPGEDIEIKITAVARDLAANLRAVIDAVPGQPNRPNEIARTLGLNRDISGRVLLATRAHEPMAVAHIIPGPEPLRRLLKAAGRRGVPANLLQQAEEAVRRFDRLIRDDAGDRAALDAIISTWLPEAREKYELAHRQSVFKGISHLKGAMAETWMNSTIVVPSPEDACKHDVTLIHGAIGMRRLRPDVRVKFGYSAMSATSMQWRPGEGGTVAPHDAGSLRLDDYLTSPPAKLDARRAGEGVVYMLAENGVGPSAARDMIVAEHHPAALDRFATTDPPQLKGMFVAPAIPSRTLVFDALLHEDVYPGADPTLIVHDAAIEGMAYINDPVRAFDRVSTGDSIEFLGKGASRFLTTEIPNYVEMLRHVCDVLGFDAQRLRGYRCRIQYPVYGWQVSMGFLPPVRPQGH